MFLMELEFKNSVIRHAMKNAREKLEGQEDISFDFYFGCGLDSFLLQRRIIIYLSTTKYIFLIEIQY